MAWVPPVTATKEGVGSPEGVAKSHRGSVWFGEAEDLQQHREAHPGAICKKISSETEIWNLPWPSYKELTEKNPNR